MSEKQYDNIVDELDAKIDELRKESERLVDQYSDLKEEHDALEVDATHLQSDITELKSQLTAQRGVIEAVGKGIKEVRDLIDDSYGVVGLHKNGDTAPWQDLEPPGEFGEWLTCFVNAEKILATLGTGAATESTEPEA